MTYHDVLDDLATARVNNQQFVALFASDKKATAVGRDCQLSRRKYGHVSRDGADLPVGPGCVDYLGPVGANGNIRKSGWGIGDYFQCAGSGGGVRELPLFGAARADGHGSQHGWNHGPGIDCVLRVE